MLDCDWSSDVCSSDLLQTLAFALGMGLLGGFLPSLRAARLGIVEALRAN
jgi:ABC-type antimicrobial peptide transport system permease subunit